jgi:hypothetical protein
MGIETGKSSVIFIVKPLPPEMIHSARITVIENTSGFQDCESGIDDVKGPAFMLEARDLISMLGLDPLTVAEDEENAAESAYGNV